AMGCPARCPGAPPRNQHLTRSHRCDKRFAGSVQIAPEGRVGVRVRKRVTVAIVGRPNVGKSTLFNRVLHRRAAVVHDEPGVTRARHYGATTWNGRAFYVVDTGGLLPEARDGIAALVRESALVAVSEADALVLVTDATSGVTALDRDVARLLLRSGKPVV